MTRQTAKQLATWMQSLPADFILFGRNDLTTQQEQALFAQQNRARTAYIKLVTDLQTADEWLAGHAENCADENINPALNNLMLGYYSELTRHIKSAAGMIWEDAGRDVNAELGYIIY